MGETISIPLSALFCKPYIQERFVRIISNGRDETPDVDHIANRRACRMANEYNAIVANRFRDDAPYYHYDALSGRAIKIESTQQQTLPKQQEQEP